MRRFFLPMASMSLLALMFFSTSCETDTPVDPGGTALGPDIRLVSEVGFISSNAQVSPGESFKVKVSAVAGDGDLKSLTIKEAGTNVPLSRLKIEVDGTEVTNNPLLITAAYSSGATWDITIESPVDAAVRTYQFTVSDNNNLSESVSIDVEVFGQLSVSLARGNDDVTVLGKSDYGVSVIGARGASPLNSLSIFADGILVPADSLLFGGVAAGSNPIVLVADEKAAFDKELVIKTDDKGTKGYTIELADESGDTVSTSFNLTVLVEYTALLVNNKDGQQKGGLDMDAGETVAFNSPLAEIRDKGIDLNKVPANNWYQQILPVNGAELRVPDLTQSENFSYDNATTRAAIMAAFDSGIAKTESDVIAVDDLFLVKRDDNYYLMQCTKVEVTASNNNDFYEFNVKQVIGKE